MVEGLDLRPRIGGRVSRRHRVAPAQTRVSRYRPIPAPVSRDDTAAMTLRCVEDVDEQLERLHARLVQIERRIRRLTTR